jgi:hypothetical protein
VRPSTTEPVMVRSASRHAAAEAPFFISFSVASSPSSLAPHGVRSKEWPWWPEKDVGRRRRWPPRRRERSPEGERAAVERIRGGAYGPVPHVGGPSKVRRRSGELAARPACPYDMYQNNTTTPAMVEAR